MSHLIVASVCLLVVLQSIEMAWASMHGPVLNSALITVRGGSIARPKAIGSKISYHARNNWKNRACKPKDEDTQKDGLDDVVEGEEEEDTEVEPADGEITSDELSLNEYADEVVDDVADEDDRESYDNYSDEYEEDGEIESSSWLSYVQPIGLAMKDAITNLDISSKIAGLSNEGSKAANDIYRRLKVMKSSAFESMILKATWPNEERIPLELINELIFQSIPAFRLSSQKTSQRLRKSSIAKSKLSQLPPKSKKSDEDPYHMTLHKIWTKALERDWRTVIKSLQLIHLIFRKSDLFSCIQFRDALLRMSKLTSFKSQKGKYFDVAAVGRVVDKDNSPYVKFIRYYAKFVISTVTEFGGRLKLLEDVSRCSPQKRLRLLIACSKSIEYALSYKLSSFEKKSALVLAAMKLVHADVRKMWILLEKHSRSLLSLDIASNSTTYNQDEVALLKSSISKIESKVSSI